MRILLVAAACLHLVATTVQGESDFKLVEAGKPRAVIFAPDEHRWAGQRLADRVKRWTGVELRVVEAAAKLDGRHEVVVVGTPDSNPAIAAALAADQRLADLGEEGYILKVATWKGRRVLVAAGLTLTGAHHAVSELVSWRLRLTDDGASVPVDLDVSEKPAMKYRILWSWDGQGNWATTIKEMHTIQIGVAGTPVVAYTKEGFLTHFKRAIDFASDHKLNGYIIWGFLRDEHGGVEAGQELSRYAKRHNVRILPGVCTQAAYGGFIYSKTNKFNLDVWSKKHPELRCKYKDGKYYPSICPSKPENHTWLREGIKWLFDTFPDIGGVNLENGDLMYCWTEDCVEAKARAENDPNFYWDQVYSYKQVLEPASSLRPDAWMTFATYTGFTKSAMRGSVESAISQRLATDFVWPPKFLHQLPANGICQWTFTGMSTPESWPTGAVPPKSNVKEHIGLLHQGSIWGAPVDPSRWWAAPSAMLDDFSPVLEFLCDRVRSTGLDGLVLKGQTGDTSPANEINYLAFEYFSWHPDRSYDQFIEERLSVCYGGVDRARQFLKLLHNTTKTVKDVEVDVQRARSEAGASDLDIRQRLRWRNLADELNRRRAILATPTSNDDLPVAAQFMDEAEQRAIRPRGPQDGHVTIAGDRADSESVVILWGKQGGKGWCPVGIHDLPRRSADQLTEAKLRIPRTDIIWSAEGSAAMLELIVQHIDAADDTRVSVADGTAPPLARIGLYRSPGRAAAANGRYVELDVARQVKADLEAGRSSFAWRIEPVSVPDEVSSQLFFPSTENTDGAFPDANRGARLILRWKAKD